MSAHQAWADWMETLKQGDLNAFKKGLEQGLTPITPPPAGQFQHWPALAEALSLNQVEIGQWIIQWCMEHSPHHIPTWRSYAEGRHHCYLHLAARFKCPGLIQPLVEAGLNVNEESWNGWPAVWLSGEETVEKSDDVVFQRKAMETFEAFVKAGANTHQKLKNGWSMGEYMFGSTSAAFFQCVLDNAHSPKWDVDLKSRLNQVEYNPFLIANQTILEAFYVQKTRQALNTTIPTCAKKPALPRI